MGGILSAWSASGEQPLVAGQLAIENLLVLGVDGATSERKSHLGSFARGGGGGKRGAVLQSSGAGVLESYACRRSLRRRVQLRVHVLRFSLFETAQLARRLGNGESCVRDAALRVPDLEEVQGAAKPARVAEIAAITC